MVCRVQKRLLAAVFLGACAALSACSSSGNSTRTASPPPPPPPPSPPPPPPDFDTQEFRNQPGLAQINALAAYDEGATGAGVIVAIVDTGIDLNNPEFENRIHPQSADLVIAGVVQAGDERATPSLQDVDDHGTPVASIIGAERDGVAVHGVAPEAELLIFRGDDDSTTDPIIFGETISEGAIRAADIGAGVLNLSLGSDEVAARTEFAGLFTFTGANDIVSVIAAGNGGDPDPDESALGALDVAGAPATIIAGAVRADNTLASFSNQAGVAAAIYLAAPGTVIPTVRVGTPLGQTEFFSGTSAAVPHVSGAAALVRGFWPTLTASEVVEILLDSATDLGAPGTDPVFGRGLLNVGAALSPSGTVTVTSVDGTAAEVSSAEAQMSGAFGAGLAAIGDIIVLDKYNRDFRVTYGDTVALAAPDRFDVEEIFSPFDDHTYASQRINTRMTARMRLTSRDRSYTDIGLNQAAAFDGAEARNDVTDDAIALALTNDLGAGRTLTVAQGFTAAAADRMSVSARRTPFLTESAFTDAYLPDAKSAITTIMRAPLSKRLTADFLVSYAYDYYDDAFGLTPDGAAQPSRSGAAIRAGLNLNLRGLQMRFEQGLRREEGAILDARFSGENTSGSTLYGAIEADWSLAPKWRLKGRYAAGYTFAQTDGFGSLIDEFSDLTTTQFSLALARNGLFGARDSLWLGVSQPLQIETGAARLTLPTGFDKLTETLSFEEISAPLAFEGRRLDFEAGYRLYAGPLGAMDINVIHQTYGATETPGVTTLVLRSGFVF